MRKLFTLALLSATVLGMSAARPLAVAVSPNLNISKAVTNDAFPKMQPRHQFTAQANKLPNALEAPITDPEGEKQFCKVSSEGYAYDYEYGIMWQMKEKGGYMVRDANTLYLLNPVSDFPIGAYIEGDIEDDAAYFELPQIIAYDEESGERCYVSIMEAFTYTTDDGQTYKGYRPVSDEDNHATYLLNADGSVELVSPSPDYNAEDYFFGEIPDYILGIYITVDEEIEMYGDDAPTYWYMCGDIKSVYRPYDIESQLTHVPESVALDTWLFGGEDSSPYFVKLGMDGNDVYVVGLLDYLPEAAVKGVREGNTVTFPTLQLFGYIDELDMFAYFAPMDYDWNQFVDIVFDYDEEAMTLTCEPDTYSLVFTASDDIEAFGYFNYIDNPYFSYQAEGLENADPEDPAYLSYEDGFFAIDGSIGLVFSTPTYNVNGYQLSADRMYYNVYVDDCLYTFDADTYWLDEDITDVPFTLDYVDIFDMGQQHMVYVYVDEMIERVGIQTFFEGTNGVLYASHKLTYSLDGELLEVTTGIDAIAQQPLEVQSVEYYTLGGMRVAKPANGVFVERTIFTDGSSFARKIKK